MCSSNGIGGYTLKVQVSRETVDRQTSPWPDIGETIL